MDSHPHTKMEFAVRMTCQSCEDSVRSVLNVPGVNSVYVDVSNELVLVESTLPSATVTQLLQKTGKLVVFRGHGGVGGAMPMPTHHGAAVAIMKGQSKVHGLARLVQVSPEQCVIDGTVDGLQPNSKHALNIHEFGDLSNGCENCGNIFRSPTDESKSSGEIGYISTDSNGKAVFQVVSEHIKVWDVIGRSMVVQQHNKSSNIRLMCGIVARSAGLFQNTKKVCTCDGVTIWDEATSKQRT